MQPLYDTYNRAALRFERGEGIWLITEGGDRYRGCCRRYGQFAGAIPIASWSIHSKIRLTSCGICPISTRFRDREKLGRRLVEATFADKVFFTNSGAEALECAIKTARRYHYVNGNPERFRIITFEGAFHGRTLATIAAGGQARNVSRRFRPEGRRLRSGAIWR